MPSFGQIYPVGHTEQVLVPVELELKPAGQGLGTADPSGHIKPAGHIILPFGKLNVRLPGQ